MDGNTRCYGLRFKSGGNRLHTPAGARTRPDSLPVEFLPLILAAGIVLVRVIGVGVIVWQKKTRYRYTSDKTAVIVPGVNPHKRHEAIISTIGILFPVSTRIRRFEDYIS